MHITQNLLSEYTSLSVVKLHLSAPSLTGCDKISNIWSPQIPPVGSFEKLKKLRIKQCGGIKILFTSQIAENLVNLEELYIKDCKQMEKVMGDLGEAVHGNSRLFPSLVRLELGELPSLKMFCEWDCSVVLPLLRSIDISNCPRMEVLTPASLIAPNLVDINLNGIENTEWNETKDLNGYIHQHIATTAKESTSNEITEEEEEEKISKLKHSMRLSIKEQKGGSIVGLAR